MPCDAARRRKADENQFGDRAPFGARHSCHQPKMGALSEIMSEFLTDAVAFLPVLARGLWTTVLLTVCALAVSLALGLVWALMGMSHHAPLRWTNNIVVNTVRGIPIIVQLFCVYFVLPDWGIDFPPFLAGVIGLGIAYSVYQAENLRGGFRSVDRQLVEAGTALGMSRGMITRRIVMPLGLRTALPRSGTRR